MLRISEVRADLRDAVDAGADRIGERVAAQLAGLAHQLRAAALAAFAALAAVALVAISALFLATGPARV